MSLTGTDMYGLGVFFEGPDVSKSGCLSFVGALVFVRVQFYVGIYYLSIRFKCPDVIQKA